MPRIYYSRKRILVTGGAGYPASRLIDRRLSDGREIVCVDGLFTGARQLRTLHG
jgi:UDP-glucuronate decarboxylase